MDCFPDNKFLLLLIKHFTDVYDFSSIFIYQVCSKYAKQFGSIHLSKMQDFQKISESQTLVIFMACLGHLRLI